MQKHTIGSVLHEGCRFRAARPAALLRSLVLSLLFTAATAWAQTAPTVVINEVMLSNGTTLMDENGDSPDWFELFNPTGERIDLNGWGVSDNAAKPLKWILQEAAIEPNGFLLLFASGKDRQILPATPIRPETIPGLCLWLRADAVDTNDTVQIRRSGSQYFIRRWNDSSGGGNHAVQETILNQPLWVRSGPSGSPVIRFDGANDQLLLPRALGTNDFCLFAVFRTSRPHEIDAESGAGVGGVSGQHYLFGSQHRGDFNSGAGLSAGTNGVSIYEHGSGYMPALAVYSGFLGPEMVVAAVNYQARRPTLDVQGMEVRAGVTSSRAQVTAPVEIGAGSYGAFGGDLAEVLLFNRSLPETERRGIEAHLGNRHGVQFPTPRHTSFQLSASGETLSIADPSGRIVDSIQFGSIPRDVSYGRKPDAGAEWLYYSQPTPGASNTTPGSIEFLSAPAFSIEGGFYTNAFDLSLSSASAGAEIRYTLDGSEPATNSFLFQNPIRIASRSGTANGISTIPTVPGGQPPLGEVFKGWTIRARVFKQGAMPGPVATRSYWVDARGRGRYSLPVVSLSTDRANFFDPSIGIYVPGNAPGGNYSQRGVEWERPTYVEFYETNNTLAFAQEAGVKIHGNTSQNFTIKGLDLDGSGGLGRKPFRHWIFPDRPRKEFGHFLLRPTGHDHHLAFMRDELMQSLGAETGAEYQAARPCVVFLNGEYWGLHYLKEKEDAEFIAYYSGLGEDEIDYLEGYAAAKQGDANHYQAMVDFAGANDLSLEENYLDMQQRMEVPSYIDYKALEIFNYRWDIGNHRLWRPRAPEGRWRWLQFDNDVGWGGFWAEQPGWAFNMLEADLTTTGSLHGHNNETTTFLLRRLMDNARFQHDFINRFADLMNTTLSVSNTIARIDRMAAALAPEMAEHVLRWREPASVKDWQANVQYLRDYARNRPVYCQRQLLDWFHLPGTAQISLAADPAGAGAIRLNSLDIAPSQGGVWTGVYFKGNSIHLEARPRPGFRFTGWGGLLGVTAPEVDIQLQGNWTITARFESEPAPSLHADWAEKNRLRLRLAATPGSTWVLETSLDLAHWTPLRTMAANSNGEAESIESASSIGNRFFRVRTP